MTPTDPLTLAVIVGLAQVIERAVYRYTDARTDPGPAAARRRFAWSTAVDLYHQGAL